MNDVLEAEIWEELSTLSKEIKIILLSELSKERADWLMGDIDHVIFSHTNNGIIKRLTEYD